MTEEQVLSVVLDLICRERITQYALLGKDDLVHAWHTIRMKFKNKEKMTQDTWASDLFAKVFNELRINPEKYEGLFSQYFKTKS